MAGGINQYGYVGGDPVNHSDPFGLCCGNLASTVVDAVAGPAFDALNPDGYVVSNQQVRVNTVILRTQLGDQSGNAAFEFKVTGGDRYSGPGGEIRSSTTGEIVSESSATSPHLEANGARAIDLRIKGVSDADVDAAIKKTQFLPQNTERGYDDKHTHVALPNEAKYKRPMM